MDAAERLSRISKRISAYQDRRQALVDVVDEFLAFASSPGIPADLKPEVASLAREMEEVKPQFPSHSRTSVLYDTAGLGKPGKDRAARLALRIEALARDVAATRSPQET